ncbi:TrbG/VirB9 family P-type conjugative transfer protein [Kiloniella litopenaei]|nr:TrbG/VirB9 family P-type conjugative transfer protein [Kiloniella litopenaei]
MAVSMVGAQAADTPSETADIHECKTLLVSVGERHSIVAHGSVGSRVRFSNPIKSAVTALPESAWDVEHKDKNLWIRPKFDKEIAKEVSQVGLTVVLSTGDEYDFLVNSTDNTDISCFFVIDKRTAFANLTLDKKEQDLIRFRNSLAGRAQELDEREAQMRADYEHSLSNTQRQVQSQAIDAIEAFKFRIRTPYEWSNSDASPKYSVVNSVYDDGQWTYVRVSEVGFGAPIITSRSGETDNVVQYEYSDITGVYKINGLHNSLHLKIEDKVVTIERKG